MKFERQAAEYTPPYLTMYSVLENAGGCISMAINTQIPGLYIHGS